MPRSTRQLLRSTSARRSLIPWLAGGLVALVPAIGLWAEASAVDEGAETVSHPAPAGLRAYIDPETGELTSSPSPEQVQTLNKAIEANSNFSSAGLEPFELRSGGRGVFLEGRFLSALTVRVQESGDFELLCADDLDGAASEAGVTHEGHGHPPAAQPQSTPQPQSAAQPQQPQWVDR